MRVELRAASRRWGTHVGLNAATLVIEAGQRVALLGPSGAGKTTLLRLIAGSLRASSGAVLVDGDNLDNLAPKALTAHRKRCAVLEQSHHCLDELSVHSNVLTGLLPTMPWYRVLGSMLWPANREQVRDCLESLGIGDRQWEKASNLSGGQRQRVAIARVLVAAPSMWLLDEPTSALDPETARSALETIESKRRDDQTLLISTHRASEVRGAVDRIIGLKGGSVVFDHDSESVSQGMLEDLYAGTRELT